MNLEDQVISLGISKKLLTLGVKQNSLFYWVRPISDWKITAVITDEDKIYFQHSVLDVFPMEYYPAFTASELADLIPDQINGEFIRYSKKDNEYKIYITSLEKCIIFFSKNLSNCMAEMLIYLIENGYMKNE